jgi:hypothetical protein
MTLSACVEDDTFVKSSGYFLKMGECFKTWLSGWILDMGEFISFYGNEELQNYVHKFSSNPIIIPGGKINK